MSTGISDSPNASRRRSSCSSMRWEFVLLVPDHLRALVCQMFRRQQFAFGDEIVREGDEPDSLFVLTSGVPESSSVAMAWTSCSAGSTPGGVR